MRDVVVVPDIQQHGGGTGAPGHHEGRKIRDLQPSLDVDGRIQHHAQEGEEEAERDEGETQARGIRRKREDQQHDGAGHVGRDGVEVRRDGAVAEAGDDLGQEELDRLQGHAEADLDAEDQPGGRVREDGQAVPQHEGLVDDAGAVERHARVRQRALLPRQEPRRRAGRRQVPEREAREAHRGGPLDDEEVAPVGQAARFDPEDPECEQAREGGRDRLGGVEEGEPAGELAAPVEGGLVVDDEREEGGFGHAEEPADGQQAGEVRHGGDE